MEGDETILKPGSAKRLAMTIAAATVYVLVLLAVMLVGRIRENRLVASNSAAGRVVWVEVIEQDSPAVRVTVDQKGQAAPVLESNSDYRSVVGTDHNRWVVEGKAQFKPGTVLRMEVRQSGRRYLCKNLSGDRKACHQVLRISDNIED